MKTFFSTLVVCVCVGVISNSSPLLPPIPSSVLKKSKRLYSPKDTEFRQSLVKTSFLQAQTNEWLLTWQYPTNVGPITDYSWELQVTTNLVDWSVVPVWRIIGWDTNEVIIRAIKPYEFFRMHGIK